MSDNIDYSELDKAVNAAINARNAAKAQPKPEPKPATVSRAPQKAAAMPARRGVVMDFAPRKSVVRKVVKPAVVKPAVARPAQPAVKPRPVAKPAVKTVVKPAPILAKKAVPAKKPLAAPINRLVNRPAVKPAVKTVARPTVAPARPASKQMLRPAAKPMTARPVAPAHVAAKPAAPARPVAKPVAKPVIEEKPEPILKKREAPNANNYSLGGRSPFMTNVKVEKRPIGVNVPETSASALRSTRNVYSQKSPTRSTENTKKHVITQDPKKKSGWLWTLIVIAVIAAGGGLGYLAYLLVFAH